MDTTKNLAAEDLDGPDEPNPIDVGFLHQDVVYQIHQTRRAVRQALRSIKVENIKIPPSGTITSLILIGLNPGITQNEIAECLFLDASKVALLLKLIEREKWVTKQRSTDDRRKLKLFLTEEGQRKFEQFCDIGKKRDLILAGGFSIRERDQLIKLLEKVQQLMIPRE